MTPERAYKIREGMFLMDVTPPLFAGPLVPPALRCALCGEAVMVGAEILRAVDVGVLVESCRQHEITRHSIAVTQEHFARGYDLSWCAGPVPGAGPDAPVRLHRQHHSYEWLDGAPENPGMVVRDPQAFAWWDSRRACPEMAGRS